MKSGFLVTVATVVVKIVGLSFVIVRVGSVMYLVGRVVVPEKIVVIDVVTCVEVRTVVMVIVDVGAKDVEIEVIHSAELVFVIVVVAESKPRLSSLALAFAAIRSLRSAILCSRATGTRRPRGASRRLGDEVRSNSEARPESALGRRFGRQVKVGSLRV